MFSRLQWLLLQLFRRVWVRVAAFSVLGIVTALLALVLKDYIPADIPAKVGADAVYNLLDIIAVSMLSVTIFSLSTMVAAFSSATSNVTPRAIALLVADNTAQNALATFLGSFLFSLVGIIVLKTGLYGPQGRLVLFAMTVLVIIVIVVTLVRWIDYVLRLGRVGPTSERVEEAATKAMRRRRDAPCLGGSPALPGATEKIERGRPVHPLQAGFVQFIDMQALQALAEECDGTVHVCALPGALAGAARPLAIVTGIKPAAGDSHREGSEERVAEIDAVLREAFNVSATRSFDQDPRFGACVLSEIASRALSPAVNDPGTAIDILVRGARVLSVWAEPTTHSQREDAQEVKYARVHVPELNLEELFDDFFVPIARDGAGMVEVGVQLQIVLCMLANTGGARYREAAAHHSAEAMERAQSALAVEADRMRVLRAAGDLAAH